MVLRAAFAPCADPGVACLPVHLVAVKDVSADVIKRISSTTTLAIEADAYSEPGKAGQRRVPRS